jgi:hypothetical protein
MKFMTTRKRRRQEKTYSPKARSAPLLDSDEICSRSDTVGDGSVGTGVRVSSRWQGSPSIDDRSIVALPTCLPA